MTEEHLEHIGLEVEGAVPGKTQPVEVHPMSPGVYRVAASPGLVEGVAAGDVIRLLDSVLGTFEVLERGGNLAVKIVCEGDISPFLDAITSKLAPLGGRLDGSIRRACVWTIPASAGFRAVEVAVGAAVSQLPEGAWWYGNVHAADGKTPLNWWNKEPS